MGNCLGILPSKKPNSKLKILREEKEKLKNSIETVDNLSRYEEAREDEKLRNKSVDLNDMVVKYLQHKVILLSDLPEDLVVEIFSRVHITSLGSVRSTCKKWNVLSRNQVLGQVSGAKNQFLGFLMMDFKIFAWRIDLQKICNDFNYLSVKQVSGGLNQIKLSRAHHCDGLLLCVLDDRSGLLVWNPYLGQRRWILLPGDISRTYKSFALGYDNNRNHKILKIFVLPSGIHFSDIVFGFYIYEFSSNLWRSIDVTPNLNMRHSLNHVTLKGNAYFVAREKINMEYFLVCFDFTSERFGPSLSLPFHSNSHADVIVLSCVRDEKLAVLHQSWQKIMEIWVTNKIDYNEVFWTKWMKVDMNLVTGLNFDPFFGSDFIDEENEVVVIFGVSYNQRDHCQTAHIIGQDGSSKSINVGGDANRGIPNVIGYFPSLVQIE